MDHPKVAILLATWNGARFLPELLASLRAQSETDWHLYVRDDGSGDGTCALLAGAAADDPRIQLVQDADGNLGAAANFGRLLERVEADYYLLADQDDVWLPTKLAAGLARLRAREAAGPAGTPVLLFSDLVVTDERLNILHPSEIRRQGFDRLISEGLTLRRLITQNVATGCTMVFNRALRDRAIPVPSEVVMHDWWLALTALATGCLDYLDSACLLYRQHAGNAMGANNPWRKALHILVRGAGPYRARQRQAALQAARLVERFGEQLADGDRKLCLLFASLAERPPLVRQYLALRHGLGRWGWLRHIGFLLLL